MLKGFQASGFQPTGFQIETAVATSKAVFARSSGGPRSAGGTNGVPLTFGRSGGSINTTGRTR